MGVANVPAAAGGGGLEPKYQKFTSSGTFTLPTGYGVAKPLLINIQVIGGGGAGSVDSWNAVNNNAFTVTHSSYFGGGGSTVKTGTLGGIAISSGNTDGAGGGSGGLAQTQMYLTSNLTITVGAAGSRPATQTFTANNQRISDNETWSGATNRGYNFSVPSGYVAGGNGGTSTAGSVSATGGNAGNLVSLNANVTWNGDYQTVQTGTTNALNIGNTSVGTAGQPAGTAGGAVPLLGAVAGGSGTNTPVYGAYGVGGKRGDGATHTGVEGTGGGVGSIGASGAVIITWWE